jgi:hypothetical protein
MRAILKSLACAVWLVCLFWGVLSATTAFGYDGETQGMMAYDGKEVLPVTPIPNPFIK